jgi:hypothetical protein
LLGSGAQSAECPGLEEESMNPEHRRLFRNNFDRARRTTISLEVSPVSTNVRAVSLLQYAGVPSEYRPALKARFLLPVANSNPIVGELLTVTRDAQVDLKDKVTTIHVKIRRTFVPNFIRAT